MNYPAQDPKAGEREYYIRLGEEGRRHAVEKPWSDSDCGRYLADMGAVLHLLGEPKRVLDMGCGTGWTSRFLAQAGHQVTGVDISPEAIALAEAAVPIGGRVSPVFLVSDYEAWSGAGDFDAVLFYDSLHHAEDEQLALRSAYKSLKPGGVVIAIEPGRGHSQSAGARAAVTQFGVHEKDMPPAQIWTLGRRAGFTRKVFLPLPRESQSTVYRRNYLRNPSGHTGERLWGLLRLVQKYLSSSHAGLVLMWKP